jgi:hypothetical protein
VVEAAGEEVVLATRVVVLPTDEVVVAAGAAVGAGAGAASAVVVGVTGAEPSATRAAGDSGRGGEPGAESDIVFLSFF